MDDGSHSGNQGLETFSINDMTRSLSLHKKLLDVEMDRIHKEIEELALELSQENRQSPSALKIREKLKELFAIEENLNIQMDLLQIELDQNQESNNEGFVKGVS